MATEQPAKFVTTVGPAPAPEVNIAGIWVSVAVLCTFVACIVIYGIYKTYLGKTSEPQRKQEGEGVPQSAPSNDAASNTIVTVSGNVPETYEQEVELEDNKV